MDNPGITLHYLESLSTEEMLGLADKFGLDIPSGFERVFIIEELLEYENENDNRKRKKNDLMQNMLEEALELPQFYNFSFIEVIVRDPLWAYVFWEISEHDRKAYEDLPNFSGYCLRVVPVTIPQVDNNSFVIEIDNNDSSRYIGFPPEPIGGRCYKIEFCAVMEDSITIIAVTRQIILPHVIESVFKSTEASIAQSVYRNPLALLSGVDKFVLTRSIDRQPRYPAEGMAAV